MSTVTRDLNFRAAVERLRHEAEPDADLLRRFIETRDPHAFASLVGRHGTMVLNLCRRLIGDLHAAEDCFQATFLILARKASTLRSAGALAGWLYGTARKVALRYRRRLGRTRNLPTDSLLDRARDPLEEVSARELLLILDEELARLPERCRLPVLLCTVEGMTVHEAARRLGASPGAVRGRLARGRAKLHARMARRGVGLPSTLAAALVLTQTAPSSELVESTVALLRSTTVPVRVAALACASTNVFLRFKITVVAVIAASALGLGALLPSGGPLPPNELPAALPLTAATDPDGEPLPPGAVQRFGTLRMRGCYPPLAFSPDGKFVACVTGPMPHVSVWEIRTAREVKAFPINSTVASIAFSTDGKRLAASGQGWQNNVMRELATGRELFAIPEEWIVFSTDGKRLIGPGPGGVFVRNAADGTLGELHALPPNCKVLAVSPDGRSFVREAFKDEPAKAPKLCDLANNSTLIELGAIEQCAGAAYSADGKRLAIATARGVTLWDVAKRQQIASWPQRSDSAPVLSADGSRVAWSGYDAKLGIAYAWAVESGGRLPRHVGAPTNQFAAPRLSPDGTTLALIDDGNALVLRDAVTGKDLGARAGHTGKVWAVYLTPDAKNLVTVDKNRTLVWERSTGRLIRGYPENLPEGEQLVPTGTTTGRELTVAADGVLRLRDLVTGREMLRLEGKHGWVGGAGRPASMSADGTVAAVVSSDYLIRVYDLGTGNIRCTFDPDAAVWGVRLSEDGHFLRVACQDRARGEVFFLDTRTGREVDAGSVPRFTGSGGGRLNLFGVDLAQWLVEQKLLDDTGRPLRMGQEFAHANVAMSPDRRYLAVRYTQSKQPGVIDRDQPPRVKVWDLTTKRPLAHVDPPGRIEENILFSPDGRLLVTTDPAGTIRLWELATGGERLRFHGHLAGEVTALAFTPDARGLLSGGADTQVLLWHLTRRSPEDIGKVKQLGDERQSYLWAALLDSDAAKAYRALCELAADPPGTVSFLADRIKPVVFDAQRTDRLIRGLDDTRFALREQASAELAQLGETAVPAMRDALSKTSSEEQRQRLRKLLEPYETNALKGERARQARAVEVLEQIGTPQARKLLDTWARGAAPARLTQEANAALQRMR